MKYMPSLESTHSLTYLTHHYLTRQVAVVVLVKQLECLLDLLYLLVAKLVSHYILSINKPHTPHLFKNTIERMLSIFLNAIVVCLGNSVDRIKHHQYSFGLSILIFYRIPSYFISLVWLRPHLLGILDWDQPAWK